MPHRDQARMLQALTGLLAAPINDLRAALIAACDAVAEAMHAEKVDVLVLEEDTQTLVAWGTSNTPLGRLQHQLGLDRLQCANGGRAVQVYRTGQPWLSGRVDEDPEELLGIRERLGVRSTIAVPLAIDAEHRGVLLVTSTQPDAFVEQDLTFLNAVGGWIGVVAQRAELVERTASQAEEQGRRTALEEIVAVLAHDVRNHLHPLTLRLSVLRRQAQQDGADANARELDAALWGLHRLGRMVSELLDMTRLEQGLFYLQLRDMDLVQLVRDVSIEMATPEQAIEVSGPDALVVCVDPGRLRQALENLLSNAARYSPAGKPVRVSVERDRAVTVVRVVDEGPGIPPELRARIFERFGRGPGGGLGLGLYLARRIAEAHGGALTVRSVAHQGTTFSLELPLEQP